MCVPRRPPAWIPMCQRPAERGPGPHRRVISGRVPDPGSVVLVAVEAALKDHAPGGVVRVPAAKRVFVASFGIRGGFRREQGNQAAGSTNRRRCRRAVTPQYPRCSSSCSCCRLRSGSCCCAARSRAWQGGAPEPAPRLQEPNVASSSVLAPPTKPNEAMAPASRPIRIVRFAILLFLHCVGVRKCLRSFGVLLLAKVILAACGLNFLHRNEIDLISGETLG